MRASEVIELQRHRIRQLEEEQERRDKAMEFYWNALHAELHETMPRVSNVGMAFCASNMRVLLGAIREANGKPFSLPGDEHAEHTS